MKKLLFAILVSGYLASCGGTSKDDQDPDDITMLKEANGFWKEGDKKHKIYYGGIFRWNEVENFKSLYPHNLVDVVSARIAGQVYQGLYRLNQKDLSVEPCLAVKHTISEDGLTWTFQIRDDVYFQDDECFSGGEGRKVTIEDVKYCFDRLCTNYPDNSLFELFADKVVGANEHYEATSKGDLPENGVSGIQIINENTIQITLIRPNRSFLKILSHNACWIFPKEAYEKYGTDMRANCVGTGAFKISKIKEDITVRMERNPKYWEFDQNGNRLPYLDVLKITFTKDKKTELSNFRRGNLDVIYQLPVDEMAAVLVSLEEAMKGGNNEFVYQQKSGLSTNYYAFRSGTKQFEDVRVRQAFNLAIDREKLVNYTLQGEGAPATGGLVPSFDEYDNSKIAGFEFNPEKARQLMAAAGYPGGQGFGDVELLINEGGSTHMILAEAIQNQLKENLGVTMKVEPLPFPVLLEKFISGKADFWRTGWSVDYPDPENFFKVFYGKMVPDDPEAKSYPNTSRYKNPKFDEYYDKATQSFDPIVANTFFQKCDSILVADAAFMPIYYDEYIRLLQLNVRAFPQNGMEYRNMAEVFFSKEDK